MKQDAHACRDGWLELTDLGRVRNENLVRYTTSKNTALYQFSLFPSVINYLYDEGYFLSTLLLFQGCLCFFIEMDHPGHEQVSPFDPNLVQSS
jgi:hypothetical protein